MVDNSTLGTVTAYFQLIEKPSDQKKFLDERKKQQKKESDIIKKSNVQTSRFVGTVWTNTYRNISLASTKALSVAKSLVSLSNIPLLNLGASALGGAGLVATGIGFRKYAVDKREQIRDETKTSLTTAKEIRDLATGIGGSTGVTGALSLYAQSQGISSDTLQNAINRFSVLRSQDTTAGRYLSSNFKSGDTSLDFLNFLNSIANSGRSLDEQKNIIGQVFGRGNISNLEELRAGLEDKTLIPKLQEILNAGGGINSLGTAITTNAIQQDRINQASAKIQAQEQLSIARRAKDVANSFIALEEKRLKKLNEAIDVFDGLDTVAKTLTATFNKLDSALIEIFKIIEFLFPKNAEPKELTVVEKIGDSLGKSYSMTPFIPTIPRKRIRYRLSENN
jgi:hypothetical protein